MTPLEFIALADKKGWSLNPIQKTMVGREVILGFEYGKNSRHYRKKFLFNKPIFLDDLRKNPPTPEQVQKFNEHLAHARKEPAPDLSEFAPSPNPAVTPEGE